MNLPASLTEIDAAWLQAALRNGGHEDLEIASVEITPLSGFTGVMGEVMTMDVTYGGSGSELPFSFIAKCPLDDELAALMNLVMQSYRREWGFYRDLAGRVPMAIPSCYVNEFDDETGRAVLVLERVSGRPGDIFAGTTAEEMATLLSLVAKMHGQFWMDPSLQELEWIFDWNSPPWSMGADMVREHWPALNAARPDMMSDGLRGAFERGWVTDIEGGLAQMAERPWTLAHCDYQLDNVIFRDDGPVIIDWQSPMRSFPGMDVAWIIATSECDEIIAEEQALLDGYRRDLAAAGGPNWSHDELVEDMCWSLNFSIPGMSIPVNEQKDLPPGQDRQHDRIEALFARCITAGERWDYAARMT